MSEEQKSSSSPESQTTAHHHQRSRLSRIVWWMIGGLVGLLIVLVGAFAIYSTTDDFSRRVGGILVSTLEESTGGKVEIQKVKFSLFHLAVEVDGLVIHGLEGPSEAPYLAADKLLVRVTLKNFLLHATGKGAIRFISLNLLRVEQPRVHMIVNKDGTTNQPVPKKPSTSNEPLMDTLLDLQVGKLELVNGLVLFNDKAIPFDLAARELGVNVRYLSASDHYGVSIGINDIRSKMQQMPEAKSHLQVEMELGRKLAEMSSLRLDTGKDSHLEASAKIVDFDHPTWEVGAKGSIEIGQISVLSGFPGLSGGKLNLDLSGHSCAVAPQEAQKQPGFWKRRHPNANPASTKVLPPDPECQKGYLLVAKANWKDAGYQDENVRVHGVDGHTEVRVTPTDLLLQAIAVDLPGGSGNIVGEMRIHNWLGVAPPEAPQKSATLKAGQKTVNVAAKAVDAKSPVAGADRKLPPVERAHAYINVVLNRVTLRTIMEVTETKSYHDLGFDTAVTGPVKVEWGGTTDDLPSSVVVNADLKMAPTGARRAGAQNIPLSGMVQAEYRGDREVVNIRRIVAQTPQTNLTASGVLGVNRGDPLTSLQMDAQFHDLGEFDSILNAIGYEQNGKKGSAALPIVLHGQAAFHGTASGPIKALNVKGHLNAQQLEAKLGSTADILLDSIVADADYSPSSVSVASSTIRRGTAVLNVSGKFQPHRVVHRGYTTYEWDNATMLDARVQLADANVKDVLEIAGQKDVPVTGTAAANVRATGTIGNIQGAGRISLRNGVAYDQPFDSIVADLSAHGRDIEVSSLQVNAQGVMVNGNGAYNLDTKHIRAHIAGNNIRLSNLEAVKKANSPVDGVLDINADANGTMEQPNLAAKLTVKNITLNKQPLGQINADVHSQGDTVYLVAHSTLATANFDVNGNVRLVGDYPMQANLKFANIDVNPFLKMYGSTIQGSSNIAGEANVSGPAKKPQLLAGNAVVHQFKVTLQGIDLTTAAPIRARLANGVATLDDLHITGQDTDLRASGSAQVFSPDGKPLPAQGGRLDVKANGTVGLAIIHVLNPNVRSSGKITFDVAAKGTTSKPSLGGKVIFENANIALADIPNGISNLRGTAIFTEDRLQLQDITGESGGGTIKLGGFVQFRGGLFADVTAKADNVRVRYYGVSATMNANARLQGNGEGAMLSGNVLITRFGLAETFDFASIAGGPSDVQMPPDPDSLLNKIRLNVRVQSAPALDFQNSYAKIAGTVDLNLRGTLAVPSVLGRVTITDGSATFNGTQYQLQRGQIYFNNPVRIDPTIDLDASARVENYDVTIGIHGTSKNFKLTYRSEPPLSEQDIFNLLALGRTQEEAQINTQQLQQQGQDPTTNAILGGALNATVSNRVNKLFGGSGKVKIDPAYVGSLGTSSARITLEEQLSRQITVVFATNVNTTAQQLIQIQYQLSANKSIVATRDENGVFSVVYKIRKRYR
ncbi:MAG: translocation/assembly module TamB domain-containing protein [Acidobacteria bacterium]|nr:translocation/assembly module TamB domain-containing protein [Acidobacteriota bacterium]